MQIPASSAPFGHFNRRKGTSVADVGLDGERLSRTAELGLERLAFTENGVDFPEVFEMMIEYDRCCQVPNCTTKSLPIHTHCHIIALLFLAFSFDQAECAAS